MKSLLRLMDYIYGLLAGPEAYERNRQITEYLTTPKKEKK